MQSNIGENIMENVSEDKKAKKYFNPFWTMGGFWILFGLIVLSASFFIKPTPLVPLMVSLIIDISAALLLIFLGGLCIWKARRTDAEDASNE
jgi:cytochrome c biogenesis protein CcdA